MVRGRGGRGIGHLGHSGPGRWTMPAGGPALRIDVCNHERRTSMRPSFVSATVFSLAMSASGAVHAVSVGQADTFSGGIAGWFAGGGPLGQVPPVPPAVVGSGGPSGAGDSFLQLTSNGSEGPGGRLVGMNAAQWAGNYAAAGVNAISMDLRN